ncbi:MULTISPECIES: ROK family transcriptional regulator [Streptomyces]|uniref:ROK family transcriptional regulator n=1 Tax=Streptomyces TaxID=1883 RepID=UPI001CCE7994|nr:MULTISPECIES: ROK family transcriptional regulator [Streptomyces]MBZ6141428.1 ROK family protein [Streptomyces olivaceus]MCM8550791.1 ROK family protein [Streptomyces sp. STCH 565 A]MCU8591190.1 ROK family protein [Streptomyces sp. A13(2022)]WFB82366.1 ROK family protein [Streptomyces olivaceus]WGK44702.1 ROK family protein [Streptomyces sp. B146]
MRRGSNQLRLADYNQAVVLELVRRSRGVSRADLQRESGLSSQTISNITRRLIDEQLIRESTPGGSARGRPSIPLVTDPDGAYSVGVHIDPARLTVVLLDLAGEVRLGRQEHTPQVTDPSEVTAFIADTVHGLITEAGVLLDPPQLPNWRDVRLGADLREATGLPVLLGKDVTAAATAELRASQETSNTFVFLYLGSGVGASVVLDNQVVRGATNNIGEVGDLLVDSDAEQLEWSGRRGGLAAACVPEALVLQAARVGLMPLPDLNDYVAVDDACSALCARAAEGDAVAARLLRRAAHRVAVGLGVLVNLLDVPRVVIGGPLWARLSPAFLPVMGDLVARELVAARGVEVQGSAVGDRVAAQGAAELVLDHFLAPRASALMVGRPARGDG